MTQVRRIWEQVDILQSQLQEEEKLIADYSLDCSLEPTGLDMEVRALLTDVALQLKEWGADTSAVLQVELAGDRIAFPMTAAGDGVFTASVSLPVEQKEDTVPVLTLLAETGGVTVREDVDNIPRTFDLMNHWNTELMMKLCPPDILVSMPFDAFGAISDYARAEEICEAGRVLMHDALDKYESGAGAE